jgi:hypothetical protein
MRRSYDPPKHEQDFEELCLRLLQAEWRMPNLKLYGHRGEVQDGIDLIDPTQVDCLDLAQCKLRGNSKTLSPREIRDEVDRVKASGRLVKRYVILTTAKRSKRAQDAVRDINITHNSEGRFVVDLYTWDDIELLLAKHPQVESEFYHSVSGEVAGEMLRLLRELHERLPPQQNAAESNPPPATVAESAKPPEDDASLTDLATQLRQNRLVVIVGDVLDGTVSLSRNALAMELSRLAEIAPNTDLFEVTADIERRHNARQLDTWVRPLIQNAIAATTSVYQALARFPISTVVSLYPDPALENALTTQESGYRSIVSDDQLVVLDLAPGGKELFLLGGSALFGTGLVVSKQHHDVLLERTKHLAVGLRDRLALRSILFLNCDWSNSTLTKLIYWLTRHLSRKEGQFFVCGESSGSGRLLSRETVHIKLETRELLLRLASRIAPTDECPRAGVTYSLKSGSAPYKYLDYFEAEDAALFFGRETESRRIVSAIFGADRRLTVLCGRSGVGKTSFVKAGVIPLIEHDARVVAAYARCGDDPQLSIANAMSARVSADREMDIAFNGNLAEHLQSCYKLDQRLQVVFVDQSEEAFIKLGEKVLTELGLAIADCIEDPDCVTRFVFVIREDHLSRMALLNGTLRGVLSNPVRLEDLSRESARDAILKPAALCGIRIEDGLADAILDDLSPNCVLPAHLQIVCDAIYRTCKEQQRMTLTAYQALGRASLILRNYLEEAIAVVPPDIELAARAVLRALVTSQETKDLVTLDEIAARSGLGLDAATRANHELVHRCRLVREVRGRDGYYELSHETLAASVSSWLTRVEASTRMAQEILDQEVSSSRKAPGHLIGGARLKLIEQHCGSLLWKNDAVKLMLASYLTRGRLPTSWIERAKSLTVPDIHEAILMRPLRSKNTTIDELWLQWKEMNWIGMTDSITLPADVGDCICHWLKSASASRLRSVLGLFAHLDSPGMGAAITDVVCGFSEPEVLHVLQGVNSTIGLAIIARLEAATPLGAGPKSMSGILRGLMHECLTWPNSSNIQSRLVRCLVLQISARTPVDSDLLDVGCVWMTDFWKQELCNPNALPLTNAIFDCIDFVSNEQLLVIGRSVVDSRSSTLADSLIARLPALDSWTAGQMLDMPWPDWGWLAVKCMKVCNIRSIRAQIVSRSTSQIAELTRRVVPALIEIDRSTAEVVVKAIIRSLSTDNSWLDKEGTARALRRTEGGTPDFLTIFRHYLGFHADDRNTNAAADLISFLASYRTELKSKEVPDLRILMSLLDWTMGPDGSLEQFSKEDREVLRRSFLEIRNRDNELDARIGSILATASDPSTDSLRLGTHVEQAAFIHRLGRLAKSPSVDISTALAVLSHGTVLNIQAQCLRLLAQWGNTSATGLALDLLGRKGRKRLPEKVALQCEAAVDEFAKTADFPDVLKMARDHGLSFALLSRLLEDEYRPTCEDIALCSRILIFLSALPWIHATNLRLKLVTNCPLLASVLVEIGQRGNAKQRYQANLIDQLAHRRHP